MKGFLYLVEIIVAAVLIAIIFQSFSAAQGSGADWTRSDLIGIGNNVMDVLGPNAVKTLNETEIFDEITDMLPANVRYTMKFSGIPKNTINVGSNDADYVRGILGEGIYLNNRMVKFNISSLSYDFDTYDVIVTTNTFDYSNITLKEFVKEKTVIGIGKGGAEYLSFFNLVTTTPTPPVEDIGFTDYTDISKYFLGFGFTILTPTIGDALGESSWGYWDILGKKLIVNATRDYVWINTVAGTPNLAERSIVYIADIDKNIIIKKIARPTVQLGITDSNFVFDSSIADGTIKPNAGSTTIVGNDNYAAVTKYGNAIWVSSIDETQTEYPNLLKALVANSEKEWYLGKPGTGYVEIPRLTSLCCDIPEVAETSLVLWYVY